jgi:hypothetical protein
LGNLIFVSSQGAVAAGKGCCKGSEPDFQAAYPAPSYGTPNLSVAAENLFSSDPVLYTGVA